MSGTAGKTQFWPMLRTAFIALYNGYRPAVGSDVRQTAQDTTDTLFNAPFACLDDAEKAELVTLLERLARAFEN